ncbi:LysR family transcriptional regulator (plasmid) [Arthrobacter sp. TES]|nr:LysR family transcriptional regulator [Arthrobacter sp. TES]
MFGEPNFTLTQLRYFVAVSEAGGITEAAKNLLVSQSAVSVAITNLEKQLGVQLFIRSHAKGVSLTGAGKSFLINARELMSHALELNDFGRDLGDSLTGELKIGCFAFIAPFFLPGVLTQFTEKHPLVHLSIAEDHLDGTQRSLLSGMCDLALLYDVNLSPKLHKETIASYPPYALLPEGHRFAGKENLSLADLQHDPLILVDLPNSRDYAVSLARHSGVEQNIAFRASSFEMVRGLVGHGHGYSILNQRPLVEQTYDGKPLVTKELVGDLPPTSLVLAHVKGTRQSRRAQAFMEVCREYFHA